jgi:hypothetical protein
MVGGSQQTVAGRLKDNPRRLGKGWARLVGSAPLKPDRKVRGRRQDSPVPLARFALRQYTRKRNCAVRGDEKPLRVESNVSQAGFEPGRIAVTQRVFGCYCASARTDNSGGLREGVSQRKDAERRDKVSVRSGKDTRSRQDP